MVHPYYQNPVSFLKEEALMHCKEVISQVLIEKNKVESHMYSMLPFV